MSQPRKRMHCDSPITCEYLQYKLPNGHTILLPLIHVGLASETEQLTTIGLLDSGATTTFIPYTIADILGIIPEIPLRTPVTTAGGVADFFSAKLKRLSLISGGGTFSDFDNVKILVPSQTIRDLPYVILGRNLVFDRFHVTFQEKRKKFVVLHHRLASK